MITKCKCGKPSHPSYIDKCEDCWVESRTENGYHPVNKPDGSGQYFHTNKHQWRKDGPIRKATS